MGVTLNGKHTDEWGLTVESLEISPPKPKTNKIKVPLELTWIYQRWTAWYIMKTEQ